MSGRSVLVTGASGLIGRRLVAQLAEDREGIGAVVALDLREVPEGERLPGVRYETGDIRDPQLGKRMQGWGSDTVAHLAAIVTPPEGSTRELEHSIDVLGTENVLRACLEAGVEQLVYTSSGAAYGYHADNPVPLVEDDALRGNPEFAYSDHKRLVEEMLARARSEHPELRQLVFRPGTILGERVTNPITAMFERPVVLGVQGSDIPFVIVWDEDVARCIAKGIRERLRSASCLRARDGARRGARARPHAARARAGELPALPPGAQQRAAQVGVRLHPRPHERGLLRALPEGPLWRVRRTRCGARRSSSPVPRAGSGRRWLAASHERSAGSVCSTATRRAWRRWRRSSSRPGPRRSRSPAT
jgi:UDP-glucose 4-epimerase